MPLNSLEKNFRKRKGASEISIEFVGEIIKDVVHEKWRKTETANQRQITIYVEPY